MASIGETIQNRAVHDALESLVQELERVRNRNVRRRRTEKDSTVFYAEVGGGLIKIGTATNLDQRVKTLYMHVLATEVGGTTREAIRHRQFADERLTKDSELFRRSDRLMRHIEELSRVAQVLNSAK
jgi:rRNA maturation protein Rpf1